MADLYGSALLDYQAENYIEDIVTSSSLEEEDVMPPLPYLFRSFSEMPILEQTALKACKGKVLDIGAGAGSHSLYLQENGFDVTALDQSEGAIETCKRRGGVVKTVHSAILDFKNEKFDSLLLLMNGIGLAGEIKNLHGFLMHLKSLMTENGQILLDSSDIIYMFESDEDGGYWVPNNGKYYGEIEFVMGYKGQFSEPFTWLYLDYRTLEHAAISANLKCELVREGEHYDFLARLSLP